MKFWAMVWRSICRGKRQFLHCLTLFISLVSYGQSQIAVNFSKNAYYPLLKSKASVFQEGLPNVPNQSTAMSMLSELEVGVFRPLVNQASGNQIWKENGEVRVALSTTYQTFIDLCHGMQISPMLTLYQTPMDFRAPGGLGKEPPEDLAGYSEGIEKFVRLYEDSKPMYWEVWNEPQNGGNFLISDDVITDYNAIYAAVAPRIQQGDPDGLIVGPAMANETDFIDEFSQAFIDNVKNNDLPLDYFSIHSYNRFNGSMDRLDNIINVSRENLGDDFQIVPIVFTEYEYHPAGANREEAQRPRERAEGAVKWLADLSYFIEQTDIPFVTWNRYLWKSEGNRPGGLIDFAQRRRPIYHAYQIFGEMPAERKELVIPIGLENAGIDGFASANSDKAGILLWNNSETAQNINLSTNSIPFKEGTAILFRVDQDNSSYLENSDTDVLQEVATFDLDEIDNLDINIPGPGIIYLSIKSDNLAAEILPVEAQFIRSWEYTPRNASGTITRDYGNFNWKHWTGRIGVKQQNGIGLCGVTMDGSPDSIGLQFKTFGMNANPEDANALAAIRIDYVSDENASKSVLIHGRAFHSSRSTELPWGAGGAVADEVIDKGNFIGNDRIFDFPLEDHAPDGWANSERRVLISFWIENTGAESQGVCRILRSGQESLTPEVPLSIIENKPAIYPNPVTDILNIEGEINKTTIEIINSSGKIVFKGQPMEKQLDVSALGSGIYFLKTQNQTIRFIKN